MKRQLISNAVGDLAGRHVQEAAEYSPIRQIVTVLPRSLWRMVVTAALVLGLALGGIALFAPGGGVTVSAYAYGTEEEITPAGVITSTGRISDSGEVTGHPLLFFLSGEEIASVRYSCKTQMIQFLDWTEKRDEFGTAQNFTVPYGPEENEYYFLLIDWIPNETIRALKYDETMTIAGLPDRLREDIIVMEITFENGKTATKAITIRLREDGTFFAAFDDYKITGADDFVQRRDVGSIPREQMYGTPEVTVTLLDAAGNDAPDDTGWYDLAQVDTVLVQWTGWSPETVRVYWAPTGTETMEETHLLQTRVPLSGDSQILLSVSDWDLSELYMGHLWIDLDYGSSKLTSDEWSVIYGPNF